MKKILTICLAALFCLPFIGCSKDDDLNGTTWVATETESETEDGVTYKSVSEWTLKFTSKTEFTLTMKFSGYEDGKLMYSENATPVTGTYTYDGSAEKGTLTAKDDEGKSSTIEFTVDGKKLTVKEDGLTLTFTKK